MSIIYDALKKVQNNISKENPDKAETAQPTKAKAKTNPLLIYILVICIGLLLGNFGYKFFSRPKTPSKPVAPLTSAQNLTPAQQDPAQLVKPIPPPAPEPPTLVLNGVFFEQGAGFALINNKIVRLGDEVEGAKVKEISMGGVLLEFEGKTIKLLSPS